LPFERQSQKLLSEGLNLLPPPDMIGEGEAEKCVNWRPDQAGKLLARAGCKLLVGGLGDWIHTIAHVESPPAAGGYVGADTKLWNYWAEGAVREVKDAITGAIVAFDGDFLGWASYQGSLWAMNKLLQGRVVGDTMYKWLPDPPPKPAVVPSDGVLSGTCSWYVTYVTARGYESNPSPATDELTLAGVPGNQYPAGPAGGGTLTIPACDDPQVIGFNVYRLGGLLPVPYQVLSYLWPDWTVNPWDRTERTFYDEGIWYDGEIQHWPDAPYLMERGVVMEDDHDPPPAAFGLAGPYFERLLAFNSVLHPNRVWYTPSMMPWYFRGSASDDGDWFDVGEEAEPIYAVSVKPHMCLIYKAHSIWRLLGDPEDGQLEQLTSHAGLRGPRAFAPHGVVDYILANEGLHLVGGDRLYKITDKIDPIFKGQTSGIARPTKPMDATAAAAYSSVMAIKNDRLYFSYPEAA
jgi:hypothetical protein